MLMNILLLMNISSSTSAMDRDTCIAFTYLPPEGSDYSDNDSFFSEIETILLPYIDTCKHFTLRGAIQKFVDKLNIFFYLLSHIKENFTS